MRLNRAHPLAKGLLAAYLFSEPAGAIVRNLVSSGMPDLLLQADASRRNNPYGRGVYNGTGGSAHGLYSAAIPTRMQTNEISLFWYGKCVSIPATTDDPDIFAIKYNSLDADPYQCLGLSVNSATSGGVIFSQNRGGAGTLATQALNGRWVVNQYTSAAITHTGSAACQCYLQGVFATGLSSGAIEYTATSYITVGNAGQTILGQNASAENHVLLVYGRPLNASEVKRLHDNPRALFLSRNIYVSSAALGAEVTTEVGAGKLILRGRQVSHSLRALTLPGKGLLSFKGKAVYHTLYNPPNPVYTSNFVTTPAPGKLIFSGKAVGQRLLKWTTAERPASPPSWTRLT